MAHMFMPDPRPQFCLQMCLSGISGDLSDPHHSESHPLQLCFLSSQLRVDSKFQQLRDHVAMPTLPWQSSRQKWASPILGLLADASTFQ